ncbi:hypothetical protein JHN63_44360 [Streptomyces sp. MBT65]|uniref:hypothetical protein n=1 Tax=Streptomyces sp. MBT65 TaxID=1488395 RepID=UPI0019099D82|nr:hypothetical protein [Streptomyces sp. MBT65]MBK3580694.1 hypothetical protein [Streptomyces sp. MBT65]
MSMRHGYGVGTVVRAAAVVAAAVLISGCSSGDSAQDKAWQAEYCDKLGSWQHEVRARTANVESAGNAALYAAKKLDKAGLEHGGTRILDDTVNAIGGDTGAEERAVSYCDSAGYETSVDSAS